MSSKAFFFNTLYHDRRLLYIPVLLLKVAMYYAASNLVSRMTGRLRCKIVGRIVHDDGFLEDFFDRKPVGIKNRPSKAVTAEQGRHIACVMRMKTIVWIIV